MSNATFTACALALTFIALLPRIFFRRDGIFNIRWLLTALPFAVAAVGLLLYKAGLAPVPLPLPADIRELLQSLSVALAVGAFGLIAYTLGGHRHPLALWHQDREAPVEIVTWGAYARIRHPFYSAFLLTLLAVLLAAPALLSLAALVYAGIALQITAVGEEKRLLAGEFGSAYRDYMRTTGRFFPRVVAS